MTAQADTKIGARAEAEAAYPQLASFIGGQRVLGRRHLPVIDPATGRELGSLPLVESADITRALETVSEAFGVWSAWPPWRRRAVLHGAAALLRQRAADIARTITLELGKPLDQAAAEVEFACQVIDYNAEEACRGAGRVIPGPTPLAHRVVVYEPVGPVAAFSSWNAPLLTPSRKVSSALAAGCSVLLKPAEQTPATALSLLDALADAGLPPGAANAIFGDPAEVGEQLLTHPAIRAVTFTGSIAVGRLVAARAAGQLKRLVTELGGHAPVIVMPDVDVEVMAPSAVRAAYRNSGQVCTSPSRFLVHRSVHDRFVAAFAEAAQDLVVGDGFDRVDIGPVANVRRIEWLSRLVADARARNLAIPFGGNRIERDGFFFAPTLILDPDAGSLVCTEEPFGPMASCTPVEGVADALEIANRLPVGLAGYVFTHDLRSLHAITSGLNCGAIAVNHWTVSAAETPFGGRGDSGHGIEGGWEGVAAFRQQKFVSEG